MLGWSQAKLMKYVQVVIKHWVSKLVGGISQLVGGLVWWAIEKSQTCWWAGLVEHIIIK